LEKHTLVQPDQGSYDGDSRLRLGRQRRYAISAAIWEELM
jgi:hypothetical protein